MPVNEASLEDQLNAAYMAFSQLSSINPDARRDGSFPFLVNEAAGDRFMPFIPLATTGKARLAPLEVDVISPPQLAIKGEAVVRLAEEPHEKRVVDGRTVKYAADLVLFGPNGTTGQFRVKRTDRSGREYHLISTKPELASKALELMLKSITHQAQTYVDTMS